MNKLLDNRILSINDVLLEPKLGILKSRKDALLKPFVYSAPMDRVTNYDVAKMLLALGQIPVLCRNLSDAEYAQGVNLLANTSGFVAVGSSHEEIRRLLESIDSTKDSNTKFNIALDVAHGDTIHAHAVTKFLREFPFIGSIMSGSIATPDGALRAIANGCTHLRVGIGPGALCVTRLVTGVGVPQLTAVYLIRRELERLGYTTTQIIADGGIKQPGDAVKYLAGGAHGVMLGSELAKAAETPGWVYAVGSNKPLKKELRGHASKAFQEEHSKIARCPEGVAHEIAYDNETLEGILSRYIDGLQSAISYLGIKSIDELRPDNVDFLEITSAAMFEGTAHIGRVV